MFIITAGSSACLVRFWKNRVHVQHLFRYKQTMPTTLLIMLGLAYSIVFREATSLFVKLSHMVSQMLQCSNLELDIPRDRLGILRIELYVFIAATVERLYSRVLFSYCTYIVTTCIVGDQCSATHSKGTTFTATAAHCTISGVGYSIFGCMCTSRAVYNEVYIFLFGLSICDEVVFCTFSVEKCEVHVAKRTAGVLYIIVYANGHGKLQILCSNGRLHSVHPFF